MSRSRSGSPTRTGATRETRVGRRNPPLLPSRPSTRTGRPPRMRVARDLVRLLVRLQPHVVRLGTGQHPQPLDPRTTRLRTAQPDDGAGDPHAHGGLVL
ncbi:hypothetical protein [Streptomyces sp. NPDC001750]|uniref:hypothetical protein n=1 Tax=Streptomyces sp. NPDC001750 TaxID=3364607 RepID=UPI003690D404